MRPAAVAGKGLSSLASAAWSAFQAVNRWIPSKAMQPRWAPGPMLKSRERTFPQFGWPRETDSLCPGCVKEVRNAVVNGEMDYRVLVEGNPGEIRARIVEREGRILMEKDCAKHGHFEDVMSIDPAFMKRMEKLYPGRDFKLAPDPWHNHGSSTVKYGRGAVLTIDLTNRCNMMCEPCFMDANQVGYVHELTWEDIKQLLDNSAEVKPRRQLSVQFSGGEPTLSPYFLDAVRYARKVGYISVQAASNGIRFAQEPEFCGAAKKAGLRFVYLQFDGVTNEANSHRKVGNLFEVKQKAIDNLYAAGVDVALVTTIVNTINNDQVGPIVRFMADNIEKMVAVAFQPVSFTGRDDEISDEDRIKYRYTLSHLAHDLKEQLGIVEPMRDWFPLSASGPFSDLLDNLQGPDAQWGSVKCGCHPNCGIGTLMLVNSRTKQMLPLPQILDTERMLEDLKVVNDAGRSRAMTLAQVMLSFLRNYRFGTAPKGLGLLGLIRVVDGYNGARLGIGKGLRYEWRMSFIGGMWFQDLFNYDFRRTEMCIIPYATQAGEISFCAYNTGVGWRQVVEKIFQTASTAKWFQAMGKHAVYAGGKNVPLPALELVGAPPRPQPATVKSDLPMFAPSGNGASEPALARDPGGNTSMSPFNAQSPLSSIGAGCGAAGRPNR
jgi:uncharacterized radical SAM superfamily Fe-S cluster-containing enzyme